MIKKRIIGVVTVKNGWAVQSFGYKRYLPLGKPECLIENLDRWGADEIFIQVIDRSNSNLGPDFELLEKVSRLRLETPLIYGGGIRNISDAIQVIKTGADRISLDSTYRKMPDNIKVISETLGAQAIIISTPMSFDSGMLGVYDYQKLEISLDIDSTRDIINSGIVSEMLVIDYKNEGYKNSFNRQIIDGLMIKKKGSVIAFGGITEDEQVNSLLNLDIVSAVAIGNSLSYREHAIQMIKKNIENKTLVRKPIFQSLLK